MSTDQTFIGPQKTFNVHPKGSEPKSAIFRRTPGEERSFTVLTWEFPLLAKYKLPVLKTKPFVEFGPSFRASGNLNGARPSRQGVTGGVGMELHKHGPAITPILRFTHWAADSTRNEMATHPNQLELVVGLRF